MSFHFADELARAVSEWDRRELPRPRLMVVAGSGLSVDLGAPSHGPFPLADLLPFAVKAVVGHPLAFELLLPQPELPVLYCRGRLHAYQGFAAPQVVFIVRLAALLGVRALVLSNAAGSLDRSRGPGSLVLIRDHLNLTGLNPLRGATPAEWGAQFPDMVAAYDPQLRELARRHAVAAGIELGEGVYCGLLGPSYETPAEIEMLARLGVDLVGMSTVLEVIAARHMGVRCLGLSLVTNLAAGITVGPLEHGEVLAVGRAAASDVERLLRGLLADTKLVVG